ncbi:glycoside hydrolase family 5 protein [Ancylobacter dichloromethanicus]
MPERAGGADGWFSTSGNQIVDSAGNPVKIAGVNWFGLESTNASPHGVWTRSFTEMMDQMKELGFNTIRLPFASDTLHASSASGIDYSQNPELQGLSPLEIMDAVIAYAGEIGLKVILDHHRSSFGAGTSDNGLWYDSAHTEAQWIDDWQMLAARYADNPAVIGADLHNEPYNGTWGGGGANDWAAAAERAGNAIGEVNPNWLILVEGVGSYDGESYWWGGNLQGVRDRPIELDVPGKLVYSAHDYGNSVYEQPWFQDPDFAQDLPAKFDEMWGYIYRENIAPVFIGEFGTRLEDPKDAPWLEALTSYMAGDFDNDGTIDLPAGAQGHQLDLLVVEPQFHRYRRHPRR